MPYLHWDTSRKREQFALEIESIMESAKANEAEYEEIQKKERKVCRQDLHEVSSNSSENTGQSSGQ